MINQDGWQNISHLKFWGGIPLGYEENHKILSQNIEFKLVIFHMWCVKPLDKYDSKFILVFKLNQAPNHEDIQYEGEKIKDHAFLTSYYMEVNSQFDNLAVLPLGKERLSVHWIER